MKTSAECGNLRENRATGMRDKDPPPDPLKLKRQLRIELFSDSKLVQQKCIRSCQESSRLILHRKLSFTVFKHGSRVQLSISEI